jgi:hypothetical protein
VTSGREVRDWIALGLASLALFLDHWHRHLRVKKEHRARRARDLERRRKKKSERSSSDQ